jgi:uncharacterized membrane protein YeaQ/YmgE (transglycosylase-associated protein family)
MNLLIYILVGTLIGWGTGRLLKGEAYGPLMDVFIGGAGGVAGALLIRSLGLSGFAGFALTSLSVIVSAAILTFLSAYVNGKRAYARQL